MTARSIDDLEACMSDTIKLAQELFGSAWVSYLGNSMSSDTRDKIYAGMGSFLSNPGSDMEFLMKAMILRIDELYEAKK